MGVVVGEGCDFGVYVVFEGYYWVDVWVVIEGVKGDFLVGFDVI